MNRSLSPKMFHGTAIIIKWTEAIIEIHKVESSNLIAKLFSVHLYTLPKRRWLPEIGY